MVFIVPCLWQIVNAGRYLLFVRKLDEKGIDQSYFFTPPTVPIPLFMVK